MKIVVTKAAKADLIAIGDFIRPHNPNRAESFVDELLNHCCRLAPMPHAYPLVPRYAHLGVRRCVVRDYLIFYRVQSNLLEIIRIIHGAQDYDKLLFAES
ncbi:MAG: type II toxin-antitoxin system RelE/ParE family toxin [Holosporaceae bacterium]